MRRDRIPRRWRGRRSLLTLFGGVLLLTACGGGGGGGGNAQNVEDQLGFDQAGILQRQIRVENMVRDCMKAQGFDYTPVDPAAQRTALIGSATLSDEEFERQFGYGITTLYEQRRQQVASGPNQVFRASLGTAERAAYDRALRGPNVSASFDVAVDTGDFAQLGGCTKQATEQVFGGPEILQTLQAKLDELDERIRTDARLVKANAGYSECMRAAGYADLEDSDEVDVVLQRKLDAIVGPADRAATSGAEAEPTYDRAALAALQREEVAMVKTDVGCQEKHVVDVEDAVRAEYERTFREQNAAFLAKVPRP